MSDKDKDRKEVDCARLEMDSYMNELLDWSKKIVADGPTDADLRTLDQKSKRFDDRLEIFQKLCHRYLLLYKESPLYAPSN
tara:strand:- start:740 stop:982 length:243 start_codon:yes stop_codon:yes gene_type:complete